MISKNRAALELVFAGSLWGFGFVAAIWALQEFTAVETMFYRFLTATTVGFLTAALFLRQTSITKKDLLRAFPAGFFMSSMLLTQTIGLQYTTASNSGFITSLYVVFVPIINSWIFRTGSSWKNYALAFVALFGTFLLVGGKLNAVNEGDLWTLICALFGALHIIYIGRISEKVDHPFQFNNFQSLWALILTLPWLYQQDRLHFATESWLPWAGILCLGIGSSVIAFSIQVRTQKVLSDATASMLFLLESPFAALFGFLILSETLGPVQVAGAVVILMASILEILLGSSAKTTEVISQSQPHPEVP